MSLIDIHKKVGDEAFPAYLLQSAQQNTPENIALFDAALNGQADKLRTIFKQFKDTGKVNPNYFYRPEDQKNALHVAAEHGYMDCVKILLDNGAVIDAIAVSKQETALILACMSNQPKMTKLLLEYNPSVNAANCYGNTALHEACHSGAIDMGKLLIAAGANVTLMNKKGSTPLHTLSYCSSSGLPFADFTDLLVNAVASSTDGQTEVIGIVDYINMRDKRGATPLLVCCTSGRIEIIKRLVHYGADIFVRDDSGQDASAVAEFYGQTEVVAYLASLTTAAGKK